MKLLKELKNYIYKVYTVSYYREIPIKIYECNLKDFYKNNINIQISRKNSPSFVHKSKNIFNKLKEYSIIISIDEEYKNLSDKTKRLILFHEIGHIVNGWCGESIADKYAIEQQGKLSIYEANKLIKYLKQYYFYSIDNINSFIFNRFVY